MMSNYDRMKGMLADYQQKESADTGGKDAENAKNEASMLRYVFVSPFFFLHRVVAFPTACLLNVNKKNKKKKN